MVVADVLSSQKLSQALLDGVNLLAAGSTTQPSLVPPSCSVRRRRRRQATLRRLFSANVEDSSLAQVGSPVPPFPSPTDSTVQTNQIEALTIDEVATCLSGLPCDQLSTCDCSLSALCHRQKKRLEIDLKLLQDQLQSGIQELNFIVSHMRLCESGMDKTGLTLAPAQPAAVRQNPVSGPASEVEVSLRPFMPIGSALGQPTAGWGLIFQDEAPQRGGQECKQQ